MEERLVEERAKYLAEIKLKEVAVRGPNFDQGLVDELNKYGDRWNPESAKRGLPTVPASPEPMGDRQNGCPKTVTEQQWVDLNTLAVPFRLTVLNYAGRSDCEVFIRHDQHGYAKRHLTAQQLMIARFPSLQIRSAIIDMRKELGFGPNYGISKTEEKEPARVARAAESRHHTCGRHGNQLVAARNQKTGEDALLCPVAGCTTILRKKRKSTLAG